MSNHEDREKAGALVFLIAWGLLELVLHPRKTSDLARGKRGWND